MSLVRNLSSCQNHRGQTPPLVSGMVTSGIDCRKIHAFRTDFALFNDYTMLIYLQK